MKLSSLALTLALLPAALFAAPSSGVVASTPTGPTVIPGGAFTAAYVINTPGSYVLGGDRTVSGAINAVEINVPDVTLDLGGFSLTPNIPGGLKNGVYVASADNIEIRNGSVSDPSASGITVTVGKRVRVLHVRVTAAGTNGIFIGADGAQIEHCHVSDCKSDNIHINGNGALVTDCMVTGAGFTGVSALNNARIIRTMAIGCKYGFDLWSTSTITECTASGSGQYGVGLGSYCTMRNCEVLKNIYGLHFHSYTSLISGSRISGNTTNMDAPAGSFIDGGGNYIQ